MLKRSDYGMTNWRSLVGEDVELRIEAELFRRDGDDASPGQAIDTPADRADSTPH